MTFYIVNKGRKFGWIKNLALISRNPELKVWKSLIILYENCGHISSGTPAMYSKITP